MSISQLASQRGNAITRTLDILVWALLVLALLPVALALLALPWASVLLSWTVPTALVVGLGIGAVLSLPLATKHWWGVLLSSVAAFGIAAFVGAQVVAHGTKNVAPVTGVVLLGMYTTLLCAMLPWLVFRARQTWIAVALVWLTLIGAWGSSFTATRGLQVIWLLIISFALLGLARLREETLVWNARHLERVGPVLWPTARAITLITLAVALIGLIPFGIAQATSLKNLLRHTPFAQGGLLAFDSPSGTPVAVLGAPLSLNAPNVSDPRTIFTYQIVGALPVTPPFLGTTLDTFDGTTWSQGPVTAIAANPSALTPGEGVTSTQVRIKLESIPQTNGMPLLLSLSNAVNFSIPARAQVVAGTGFSATTIANWLMKGSLTPDTSYTSTALILSDNVQGSGTLDPTLQARMTTVPPALQPTLQAAAQKLIGKATTPTGKAEALISGLAAEMKLDPSASPPQGVEPIQWFLTNKHGNILLWTTTYLLLGRSLGLPMRLAEGYLAGTYDSTSSTQVVRGSDASVWAQLAIPGKGWLDLFPVAHVQTVTVPGTIINKPDTSPTPRPTTAITPFPGQQQTPSQVGNGHASPGSSLLTGILAVLALVLVVGGGIIALLSMRWNRFGSHLPALPRLFARIALLARLAGIKLAGSDTASQATAKVAAFVPEQREMLTTLNHAYERFVYGPPAHHGMMPQLSSAWQRISQRLWQLIINRPWRRDQRESHTKG